MSHKYKSFTKGMAESYAELPPGVKRVGYLRKLKKMKKRFFVLHSESENAQARLEYYSSEKKWRSGSESRRCIELKTCFNIGRKLHSKLKFVVALYTEDDCFSIAMETSEELEQWLNDILEEHHSSVSVDEETKGKPIYEHVWQVNIDDNDLEFSRNIRGPYRIALSSKSLTLIKMSPSTEKVDVLEFPLMSIRRCGHSGKHFFIELGRSAVTGAGGMWMETEATIVAQNMHETVLGAMKSSRSKDEASATPRPRSASTSENSKPVPARRPVGIVTPQTLLSTNSILSNSRERCDSLPTRPQTISGNMNNTLIGTLSSPFTSNEPGLQTLGSRPHSMYEWPSFNSPSGRNRSFSPGSLPGDSNTTSCEDLTALQPTHHAITYPHSASSDKILSSKKPISEVPDEYFTMSPQKEDNAVQPDYISMNPHSENVAGNEHNPLGMMDARADKENSRPAIDYVDMHTTSFPLNAALEEVRPNGYLPMAHGGVSEETPVLFQDGYLDMSPLCDSSLRNLAQENCQNRLANKSERCEENKLILNKVPALLKTTAEKSVSDRKDFSLAETFAYDPQQKENSELRNFLSCEPLLHKRMINTKSHSSRETESLMFDSPNSAPSPSISVHQCSSTSEKSEFPKPLAILNNNTEKQASCLPVSSCKVTYSTKAESDFFSNNILPNSSSVLPVMQKDATQNVYCKPYESTLDHKKEVSFLQPSTFPSECVQVEENLELDNDQESLKKTPYKATNIKNSKVSPVDQNTNFSCFLQNQNSRTDHFTCAPLCSVVNKMGNNVKHPSLNRTAQNYGDHSSHKCNKSTSRYSESACNIKENCLGSQTDSHNRDNFLSNFAINSIPETCNKIESHLLAPKVMSDMVPSQSEYVNLNFGKPSSKQTSQIIKLPPPIPPMDDINYTNIHLGKPFCPTPNLTVAMTEEIPSSIANIPYIVAGADTSASANQPAMKKTASPKVTCPHSLPAFRKQMSAPAGPSSLMVDLPSPGRKSSCPVTASVSMIKPPLPISSHKPVPFQALGAPLGHLRVTSSSRSPDHSSVSSISSASDEVSSSHSSPKLLGGNRLVVTDGVYENVDIPLRPSASRSALVSNEKELNYASLDLAPTTKNEITQSPSICKSSTIVDADESLTYAQIDFTKSEGLKNTSGTLREGRL